MDSWLVELFEIWREKCPKLFVHSAGQVGGAIHV
jgi:hypothetical protein